MNCESCLLVFPIILYHIPIASNILNSVPSLAFHQGCHKFVSTLISSSRQPRYVCSWRALLSQADSPNNAASAERSTRYNINYGSNVSRLRVLGDMSLYVGCSSQLLYIRSSWIVENYSGKTKAPLSVQFLLLERYITYSLMWMC